MKNHIRTLAICGSILALGTTVQAQITPVNTGQTASWSGTITFSTGAAPTTDSGGTSQDNDNWGGNTGGVAGFGSLAETFTLSSSGTLQNFQVVMAGAAATFDVSLYDLGPVASFNAGTAGVYPAVPGQINFVPTTMVRTQVDLLSPNDQFVYGGVAGQSLYTLTPTETVNLVSGEVYALALDPTNNADGTWWVRGGLPSASYSNGEGWNTDSGTYAYAYQNFEGKAGPYSSGGRNFDLGVTLVVPEPTSMALLGLGALVGAFAVRRRDK
jgi:PEP-CTERM motif